VQAVTTPDGRVWYVRRRWAKRQLPWKQRPEHKLSPAERDTVPVLGGRLVYAVLEGDERGLVVVLRYER
jgi:hypothetical protein